MVGLGEGPIWFFFPAFMQWAAFSGGVWWRSISLLRYKAIPFVIARNDTYPVDSHRAFLQSPSLSFSPRVCFAYAHAELRLVIPVLIARHELHH
jgi:hypothetical protein